MSEDTLKLLLQGYQLASKLAAKYGKPVGSSRYLMIEDAGRHGAEDAVLAILNDPIEKPENYVMRSVNNAARKAAKKYPREKSLNDMVAKGFDLVASTYDTPDIDLADCCKDILDADIMTMFRRGFNGEAVARQLNINPATVSRRWREIERRYDAGITYPDPYYIKWRQEFTAWAKHIPPVEPWDQYFGCWLSESGWLYSLIMGPRVRVMSHAQLRKRLGHLCPDVEMPTGIINVDGMLPYQSRAWARRAAEVRKGWRDDPANRKPWERNKGSVKLTLDVITPVKHRGYYAIDDEEPPTTVAEIMDRYESIRAQHGFINV